jgi:hypothetical protein
LTRFKSLEKVDAVAMHLCGLCSLVDFQNVNFQNVDFQNVEFQNVDFQNVDFQNVTKLTMLTVVEPLLTAPNGVRCPSQVLMIAK